MFLFPQLCQVYNISTKEWNCGFFSLIDRKLICANFRGLSTLLFLRSLVFVGVDVESGVKSCTGEAFELILTGFSLEKELRFCVETLA